MTAPPRDGDRGQAQRGSDLRVLVGSDLRFFREGLVRALVAATPPIDALGSGLQLIIQSTSRYRPHVVLLDVGRGGDKLIRQLVEVTGTPVVVLGIAETDQSVVALAEAGVAGYLTIDDGVSEVVAQVRAAAIGESICSPRAAAVLLRRVALKACASGSERPALTSREEEIARLVAAGLTNRAIADHLVIQLATVKNHVHNVLEKLDISSRADVAKAMGAGAMIAAGEPR